jgi:hypothetical protein
MSDYLPITGGAMNGKLYDVYGNEVTGVSGGVLGTVTQVSVTSANGVSGSVATSTTTPAITLSLGAITPTSVAASGTVTGSNFSGSNTGDETTTTIKTKLGITTLSGDNTGDQTLASLGAQAQLNGTGFVKATGTSISYDNSTYLTAVTAHNLLSTTHGDTLADTVVRGDIVYGNATPKWARLAFPATPTGKILQATATDIAWSANPLTIGASASVSGSNTGDQTLPVGGTPALTLGTANAAGSAATFVKTDATLLAFDVTSPTTQAFGDAAAVGTATVAARRDHKHAMMVAPTIPSFLFYQVFS